MFLSFLCVCFREYYVFMHWGLFMNWIRGSLEFNVQWWVIGYCWHFSAKSAIFFASFFNSTEQFNEESSKLDDVTSSPVFAGLHFDFIFWWISDKESGKLSSVAMIAVDKGMTGGRCRTEETKLYRMDQKVGRGSICWIM